MAPSYIQWNFAGCYHMFEAGIRQAIPQAAREEATQFCGDFPNPT